MEISPRNWIIIGVAALVAFFLLRGKGGVAAASVTTLPGGGGGTGSLASLAQSEMDYQYKLQALQANTDVAKAQIEASKANTAAQLASQTALAQIAATVSSQNSQTQAATSANALAVQAANLRAQLQAQQNIQNSRNNAVLIPGLVNAGTSILGSIFGFGDYGYDPTQGIFGGGW